MSAAAAVGRKQKLLRRRIKTNGSISRTFWPKTNH